MMAENCAAGGPSAIEQKENMSTPPAAPLPEIPRPNPNDRPDPKPAKLWTLIVGVAAAVVLAAVLGLVVFNLTLQHLHIPAAEAARTAVTLIGVPTAAGAVFVALRNLRLKERQLHVDQQRVVDAYRTYALAFDAEHTRRTYDQERELRTRYVSAAEQIGNDSAAVRLAGVNAMAHLANDWREQRQSCVDVLCAYLRLPQLRISGGSFVNSDIDDPADGEVRRTVQRLLAEGFRKGSKDESPAWPDTDLDLDGAVLDGFTLADAVIRRASFKRTRFKGQTVFVGGSIKRVSFTHAVFLGNFRIRRSVFASSDFLAAVFEKDVTLQIFWVDTPSFKWAAFKGKLQALKPSVGQPHQYRFDTASFLTPPPNETWITYENCTLNGTPYDPPERSDDAGQRSIVTDPT